MGYIGKNTQLVCHIFILVRAIRMPIDELAQECVGNLAARASDWVSFTTNLSDIHGKLRFWEALELLYASAAPLTWIDKQDIVDIHAHYLTPEAWMYHSLLTTITTSANNLFIDASNPYVDEIAAQVFVQEQFVNLGLSYSPCIQAPYTAAANLLDIISLTSFFVISARDSRCLSSIAPHNIGCDSTPGRAATSPVASAFGTHTFSPCYAGSGECWG